ncbi:hypothetical protein HYW43_00275 [Candidatus Daviesbacteria bacterium]|nr:hypothetical protein [Candidatus Daviesbacteria bacterium]
MARVELRVLYDQHGTYKWPIIGGVRCTMMQISEQQREVLQDPANLSSLAARHVKICRKLSEKMGLLPKIRNALELREFIASTLRYRVRPEQKQGLRDLAGKGQVPCTLISATNAAHAEWVWWGLGREGRHYTDPNFQMMLKLGGDPMFVKLIMVGVAIHRLDQSPEERVNQLPRRVELVDEDPNFLRNVFIIFGLEGHAPISLKQAERYPKLKLLGTREIGRYEGFHLNRGLPEVYSDYFPQQNSNLLAIP